MLAAKCAIYAQGCDKRGKFGEAALYRNQGWEAGPNGPGEATAAGR